MRLREVSIVLLQEFISQHPVVEEATLMLRVLSGERVIDDIMKIGNI
jgi:hypothetical protein